MARSLWQGLSLTQADKGTEGTPQANQKYIPEGDNMRKFCIFLLLLLPFAALAEAPYLQRVSRPDEMIFSGPGYDEFCVGTVGEAGTFTIVEEADDGEGHLWGRLKSGAGWIDLTHVRDEAIAAWPVSAAFAQDCRIQGGYHAFCEENSEYTTWIVLRVYEPLTDVSLLRLNLAAETDFIPAEVLYSLPEMTSDTPLLAGVVFYGDMTTYAIQGTDADGATHLFALSISGRNGMLILEKLDAAP